MTASEDALSTSGDGPSRMVPWRFMDGHVEDVRLEVSDEPSTRTVIVTMTVEVEPGANALDVAGGWLPRTGELPLSASDGRLLSVEIRRG